MPKSLLLMCPEFWCSVKCVIAISLRFAVMGALAALMSACSSGGFAVDGKVVDAETNMPIAKAWVVQEWAVRDRFRIPFSWDRIQTLPCQEGQFTKSDAQGNFHFDPPTTLKFSLLSSTHSVMTAMLPGFQTDSVRAEEGVSEKGLTKSIATVVVRKKAMSNEQLEMQAFDQMVSGGRCRVRPVPDELKRERAAFLKSRGVNRAEMVNRVLTRLSHSFSRTVTEDELKTPGQYEEELEALKLLE